MNVKDVGSVMESLVGRMSMGAIPHKGIIRRDATQERMGNHNHKHGVLRLLFLSEAVGSFIKMEAKLL